MTKDNCSDTPKKKKTNKRLAEDFFIENFNATQKEVAELFGVTENTISAWAKAGDWTKRREEYHSSPVKIKQLLQQELLSVAQGNPAKLNADSISKLQKVIGELKKYADPTVIQQILKDLDNFVAEQDPKLASKMTGFHRQFLIHRINLDS